MDALVLVDVTDSHGMMLSRQRFVLHCPGPPVLIGRDVACDVVINDPYAAPRHAALSLRADGTVGIDDLGTLNGLIAGDERVRQATIADPAGTTVQVGHSHLRIRTAATPLAPERPDLESLRSRHREYAVAVIGALLCGGFAGLSAWIGAPDNPTAAFVLDLLGGTAVLAAWFGFWVLLGRAVRSRWQWTTNAAVTLGVAAACLWTWWGIDVAIFATGETRAALAGGGLILLLAGLAIYLEVRTATRFGRARAAGLATLVPLLGCVAYLWFQQQQHVADVNRITPPGEIFPPDWSLQPGMRLDRFFDEGLDLRDAADRQRGSGPQP